MINKKLPVMQVHWRGNKLLHGGPNYNKKIEIQKGKAPLSLAINLEDIPGNQTSAREERVRLAQRCHSSTVLARNRVERFSALDAVLDRLWFSRALTCHIFHRRAAFLSRLRLGMGRRVVGGTAGVNTQSRATRNARSSNIIPLL